MDKLEKYKQIIKEQFRGGGGDSPQARMDVYATDVNLLHEEYDELCLGALNHHACVPIPPPIGEAL